MSKQEAMVLSLADPYIHSVYDHLRRSRRTVILTGAGISCNAGIPDFRSSSGLYSLSQGGGSAAKGKLLFDISAFSTEESMRSFARFMSSLYIHTDQASPTRTHRFIAKRVSEKKVLRCYTQNIDGIEAKCHLTTDFENQTAKTALQRWKALDVVQLHGDINTLSCTICSMKVPWTRSFTRTLQDGDLPECPGCLDNVERRAEAGKRTTGQVGLLRPSIVLYGENHPYSEMITTGLNSDLKARPDMLLIMGTSLKVHGVKQLVKSLSHAIHLRGGIVVLVNKDVIPGWKGIIDYQVNSDCDEFVLDYERYENSEELKKKLPTPPSTPKKCRIRDLLNSPTPSPKKKKRRFEVFQDQLRLSTSRKKTSESTLITTPDEPLATISPGTARANAGHLSKMMTYL